MHLLLLSLIVITASSDHLLISHFNQPLMHGYSDQVSVQISESIKIKLVQNISLISNETLAKLLLDDLFQEKDEKRALTSIDRISSEQIFKIFNLKPPICDKNNDGVIQGTELKCFNKIWKYYIPGNEYY